MTIKYYRVKETFLGAFDDKNVPVGATSCPAPDNATDIWVNGKWESCEEALREQFKKNRSSLIKDIRVEVNGKMFDGDEVSQGRMARSLVALKDDETITWVLSDNTPAQVSKEDLLEALRLAGAKQTELWVYEGV